MKEEEAKPKIKEENHQFIEKTSFEFEVACNQLQDCQEEYIKKTNQINLL